MQKRIGTLAGFAAGTIFGALTLVSSTGQAAVVHHHGRAALTTSSCMSAADQRAALLTLREIAVSDTPAHSDTTAYPALRSDALSAAATLAQINSSC